MIQNNKQTKKESAVADKRIKEQMGLLLSGRRLKGISKIERLDIISLRFHFQSVNNKEISLDYVANAYLFSRNFEVRMILESGIS